MKLNGTARGRNMEELLADAHRQAKLFYGNDDYNLKIATPRADTEYHHYVDGRVDPIRTTFDMDFTTESPATIEDARL